MKRQINSINKIIIHHSLTPRDLPLHQSVSSFDRTHKKRLHPKRNSIGYHLAYHFVIGPKGKYITTRGLDEVGYHASNLAINKTSIGICLTGNFDVMEPTPAQYKTLIKLIERLRGELGELTIHRHNEYSKKSCPGKNFNFAKLKEMLFYKKLYTEAMEGVERNNKVIKEPEGAIEKMKDLSKEEMLSELIYFTCFGLEKLKGNIK